MPFKGVQPEVVVRSWGALTADHVRVAREALELREWGRDSAELSVECARLGLCLEGDEGERVRARYGELADRRAQAVGLVLVELLEEGDFEGGTPAEPLKWAWGEGWLCEGALGRANRLSETLREVARANGAALRAGMRQLAAELGKPPRRRGPAAGAAAGATTGAGEPRAAEAAAAERQRRAAAENPLIARGTGQPAGAAAAAERRVAWAAAASSSESSGPASRSLDGACSHIPGTVSGGAGGAVQGAAADGGTDGGSRARAPALAADWRPQVCGWCRGTVGPLGHLQRACPAKQAGESRVPKSKGAGMAQRGPQPNPWPRQDGGGGGAKGAGWAPAAPVYAAPYPSQGVPARYGGPHQPPWR